MAKGKTSAKVAGLTAKSVTAPPRPPLLDFAEIVDGETWELFSRDLLQTLGFTIQEPPDRGADGGRDFIAVEHLKGQLGNFDFRWLVSCKHNARSQKAVSPTDEQNILERVAAFKAQGFFGIYSTIASAGLGQSLSRLRDSGALTRYRLLDHRVIEHYVIQAGYSHLVSRYLPNSYRRVKPLHPLGGKYVPLECVICQKDLLIDMYHRRDMSLIQFGESNGASGREVTGIFWSCKGKCGNAVEAKFGTEYAGWRGLNDLVIPVSYLEFTWTILREIRGGKRFHDSAFRQLSELLFALGQKVFREMTEEEREHAQDARELLSLGF